MGVGEVSLEGLVSRAVAGMFESLIVLVSYYMVMGARRHTSHSHRARR